MAKPDCNACEELRSHAPDFVQNGVTDTICTSLKNNTGLNPSATVINDDCTDLDLANDCLVGRMDKEVDAYDVCDWKEFMHQFIPNLWNLLKALICAICGLWTKSEKHDCELEYLFNGATFSIGESTSGDAYAVAGKGVSFLTAHGESVHTSDLHLRYVAGGFGMGGGSYKFYDEDFTDEQSVGNFDNGSTYRESSSRKGNSIWGQEGRPASGGELICEFRIKKSAYPQIKKIYRGFGQETGGGAYHVDFSIHDEGEYAWGQHGWCDDDGTPSADGYDSGHLVPEGWLYLQLRLTYAFQMKAGGQQYTPQYHFGMRMNQDAIEC